MERSLVMTIIGPDKPGLVDSLAATIRLHNGNWLESRMCHLGGQFAGLLRVQIPASQEPALLEALTHLHNTGLQVMAQSDISSSVLTKPDTLATLELVGQDRPGIVSEISRTLAGHGVNVEELQSECVSAPMSAEPLFQARAKLKIPAACNTGTLRRDLEKIASDLMVDITFAAGGTA